MDEKKITLDLHGKSGKDHERRRECTTLTLAVATVKAVAEYRASRPTHSSLLTVHSSLCMLLLARLEHLQRKGQIVRHNFL